MNHFKQCVILTLFSMGVSFIFYPIMPQIALDFNVTDSQIQFVVIIYALCISVSKILLGIFSDHYGRQFILSLSMLLFSASCLLCIFSSHWILFILGMITQSIALGGLSILPTTLLYDHHPDRDLASVLARLGYYSILGSTLSILLGGLFQTIPHWKMVYVFLLATALLFWFFLSQYQGEPVKRYSAELKSREKTRIYQTLTKNKDVLLNMGCLALGVSASGVYYVAYPFLFSHQFHLSKMVSALLLSSSAAPYAIGLMLAQTMSRRCTENKKYIVLIAMLVIVFSGIFLLICYRYQYTSLFSLILPTTLYAGSMGIINPLITEKLFHSISRQAGLCSGMLNISTSLMFSCSGLLSATLTYKTSLLMGIVLLVSGLVMLILRMIQT